MTRSSKHPDPPATLAPAGAEVWRSTVRLFPPGYFDAPNRVLLSQFCEQVAHIGECTEAIRQHGLLIAGRANPAVAMRSNALTHCRALAEKLRLPISSTIAKDASAAKSNPKHSLKKPWES